MQDRRGSRTALSEFALFGSNWRKLELKPATIWKWSLVAVISVVSYRAKNIDNYHRTRTRSPLQILSVKDFVIVKCLPPLKKDWSLPFLAGLQMQIANADCKCRFGRTLEMIDSLRVLDGLFLLRKGYRWKGILLAETTTEESRRKQIIEEQRVLDKRP